MEDRRKDLQLRQAIEDFKPYILQLEQEVQELGWGQLQLTLNVCDSFVKDMVVSRVKRHRYERPDRTDLVLQEEIETTRRITSYHA